MGRAKKNNKQKHVENELSNEIEVEEPLKQIDSNPTPSTTIVNNQDFSNKRSLEDQDSDSDSEAKKKPKKKKKLAQPVVETKDSGKKTKKSIRQMKKERYLQRQADAALAAKDQLKSQCHNYLSQWKHDRQNWKFMKAKQVWLYKNKFSIELVPDDSWPLLLEYFESAQGNIRKMLLDDANKIIKQMDDWTELQNQDDKNESDDINSSKPDDVIYNRARNIIQCLEE